MTDSRTPLYDLLRELRTRELAVIETQNKIARYQLQLVGGDPDKVLLGMDHGRPGGDETAVVIIVPETPAKPVTPTAVAMVQSVLSDLPKPFWYSDVKRMLETLYPYAANIRQSTYSGVAQLLERKLIQRTANGFEVVPTGKQASVGSSAAVV